MSITDLCRLLMRWSFCLSEYKNTVKYKNREHNIVVVIVSRILSQVFTMVPTEDMIPCFLTKYFSIINASRVFKDGEPFLAMKEIPKVKEISTQMSLDGVL